MKLSITCGCNLINSIKLRCNNNIIITICAKASCEIVYNQSLSQCLHKVASINKPVFPISSTYTHAIKHTEKCDDTSNDTIKSHLHSQDLLP